MVRQNRIDHRPGRLDRVLAGEQRAVAGHGVAEQPFVGRPLVRLHVEQIQLALVADELLAGPLHPSGQRDGGTGGNPKSQIIGRPALGHGVGKEPLRRRLQLDQHLGGRLGQALARPQVPRHARPAPRVDRTAARAQKVSTSESFATPASSR